LFDDVLFSILVAANVALDLMWSESFPIVVALIQLVATNLTANLMWFQFALGAVTLIQVQFDPTEPLKFYVP
jgi:hypothetical protein